MESCQKRRWLTLRSGGALAAWCLLLALLFLVLPAYSQNGDKQPATAQNQTDSQAAVQSPPQGQAVTAPEPTPGPDDIRFYSFLDKIDMMPPGPAAKFAESHPEFKKWDKGPRLMVQWYFWSNQKRPFGQSFLFILFFSVVFWALAPIVMKTAQSQVRQSYWSTFLIGIVAVFVLQTAARSVLATLIGWPLGIGLIAVEELLLIAGLAVVVSLLGQSIGYFARLEKWPLVGQRADARRFTELFIGAAICGLLLQIPGIGALPKLGTRLVALLAVLGMGALYRAWKSLKTQ